MRALVLILLLTGCATTASGPMFSEQKTPSIVIYTDYSKKAWFGNGRAGTWDVNVDGMTCKLHDKSFFVIPAGKTTITSEDDFVAGTTKYEIKDNIPHYIRLDIDHAKMHMGSFGLIGLATIHDSNGMYIFEDVSRERALKELNGLHQDCV